MDIHAGLHAGRDAQLVYFRAEIGTVRLDHDAKIRRAFLVDVSMAEQKGTTSAV